MKELCQAIRAALKGEGYAPGWRLRCTTCGTTRDAAEVGMVRIGASRGKWTVGRCSVCGRIRVIAIEKKPEPAPPDGEAGDEAA